MGEAGPVTAAPTADSDDKSCPSTDLAGSNHQGRCRMERGLSHFLSLGHLMTKADAVGRQTSAATLALSFQLRSETAPFPLLASPSPVAAMSAVRPRCEIPPPRGRGRLETAPRPCDS